MSARWKSVALPPDGAARQLTAPLFAFAQGLRRVWTGPLAEPPLPWLNPDKKLLVVWGAKCACTASFVWFANTLGLLAEMRALRKHPHRYRAENYYRSDLYRRGRAIPVADFTVVHILRDPYSRAVASYRQALKTGYADKRLAVAAAGPLDSRTGFSFSQFLGYLETIDLAHANIHHKLQFHPVEAIRPADRVINISRQDLFTELNRVAGDYGLPHTDFAALDWLHARESNRRARTQPFAGAGVAELRFDVGAALGRSPWPDYSQFLSPPIRRRIDALYARDFEAFADQL